MRHFRKQREPDSFRAWKDSSNENWAATYAKLQNPEKADLHRALLSEQGDYCCYCGRPADSSSSHVEHFRPQYPSGPYEHLALEYENLHASCNGRPAKAHCGHAKRNWFDEDLAISPLEQECESRFRYELNGPVWPKREGDAGAEAMILHLKLNALSLVDDRARILLPLFEPDFIESATREELLRFRRIYFSEDGSPLEPFAHVIVRFAEHLAGDA